MAKVDNTDHVVPWEVFKIEGKRHWVSNLHSFSRPKEIKKEISKPIQFCYRDVMDTANRIHLIFCNFCIQVKSSQTTEMEEKLFWKMHCFFFSFIRCCQLPLKPYLFRSFPNPTIQGSFGISCHERLHLVKRKWGNMIELLLPRIVLLCSSVFLNILIVLQTSKTLFTAFRFSFMIVVSQKQFASM